MNALTNAHTHLELSGLRHLCPAHPTGFLPWMARLVWAKRESKPAIAAAIRTGIDELRACGTTHVADITATWESVEPLLASGLSGVVYLEVLSPARRRSRAEAVLRLIPQGRIQSG